MVDALLPWLKYIKSIVLRIDWNNEREIVSLSHPIMFFAGQSDELVPHWHMQRLYELSKNSSFRQWHAIRGGQHNDSWLRGGLAYFESFRNFIEKVSETTVNPSTSSCPADFLDAPNADKAIPSMLEQPLFSMHAPKD